MIAVTLEELQSKMEPQIQNLKSRMMAYFPDAAEGSISLRIQREEQELVNLGCQLTFYFAFSAGVVLERAAGKSDAEVAKMLSDNFDASLDVAYRKFSADYWRKKYGDLLARSDDDRPDSGKPLMGA